MNILFQQHYPHATLGCIAQPQLQMANWPASAPTQPMELLDAYWPLQDINFHSKLDYAISLWQEHFFKEMRNLVEIDIQSWPHANFNAINQLLETWLRVVKKMEFYRLEGDFRNLVFHPHGLYTLYQHGNLKSIYILNELQKYRTLEEADILSELKKQQQASIFRDVSLKIARHVLTELKEQMYLPGKELMMRLLKLYGFKYDCSQGFGENYIKALRDKQILSLQSRQAAIVMFTLKIMYQLQTIEGLCYYLGYLKCVLLDRSSGVLSAEYDLWTLLYETCLKIYARHPTTREKSLLQIDQILTSPLLDQQFQNFLIKNLLMSNISLSSVNFYLKNCKKEQRQELRGLILTKIEKIIEQNLWPSIEDIFQFYQNELEGEEQKAYMKKILSKILELPYQVINKHQLYEVQYGVSFLIENAIKYIEDQVELLRDDLIAQMIKVVEHCRKTKEVSPSLVICFRLFNMFLGTAYLEIDHEQWRVKHIKRIIELVRQFYSLGLLCSKAALKLIYHLISQENEENLWEEYFSILVEHYFTGGYDQNSDLEIIHSHQQHKEVLASKILQKFSELSSCQLIQNRELSALLDRDSNAALNQSFFAVKGQRDETLRQAIQNICLIFSSHLSIQTLEFSCNLISAFGYLPSWEIQEEEPSLLSLICEQMPIQVLKFVFKELSSEDTQSWKQIEAIPSSFWSEYWSSINGSAKSLSSCKLDIYQILALQRLRRLQFVMDLASCVFDKLNEHSQKNIKEIKLIYDGGVAMASKVISKLSGAFLQGAALALLNKAEKLSMEEVKGLSLCGDDNSLMDQCYISNNSFLATSKLFNEIGRVNGSSKLQDFKKLLVPSFPQLPCTCKNEVTQIFYKQFQIISTIQSAWIDHLTDNQSIHLSKEWEKQMTSILEQFKYSLNKIQKDQKAQKDSLGALRQRLNQHIKGLLGRLVLPSALTQLLMKDNRNSTKITIALMKSIAETINCMDADYEEHFISMVQRLEDDLKQSGKSWSVQPGQILSLLELMLQLIFSGVRIRSYHLYRVIKYYQKAANEPAGLFNSIIASYIRLCFQEFITNYKPPAQFIQLSASKKVLTASHLKLSRQQIKLGTIEAACMLSMFINLFCRLNYPSLGAGVQKIFGEDEGKIIYIDYLISLSRRIALQQTSITPRELEILKIDVYGNLTIFIKTSLSQRLLNKMVSLAKHLLRVQLDMKGINQMPVKLLAEKLALEPIALNLEEFEDQCKAISLGALSVHRRISTIINSNIHLANIYFISGKSVAQNVDLNSKLFSQKSKAQEQMKKLSKAGIQGLFINVEPTVGVVIDGLLAKIERFHDLCSKDSEYIEKLYATFKILCITALNLPQILPLILQKHIKVKQFSFIFMDFLLETLKICLPLFCEFAALMIKTNCSFTEIGQGQFVPYSLVFETQVRQKMVMLLSNQVSKGQSEYTFLPKAIAFLQTYPENNRFRAYRFVKIHNETYEQLTKQSQRQFNLKLIKVCQVYISNKSRSSFSCENILQILQYALQKSNNHSALLDLQKLHTQQGLSKIYLSERDTSNKENLPETQRRSSRQSLSSKQTQKDNQKLTKLLEKVAAMSNTATSIMKGTAFKSQKLLQATKIQEQIISLCQSKMLETQWQNCASDEGINRKMVEKFKMFNEQIQSKQFMKDMTAFPSKNGIDLIDKSMLMAQDAIPEIDSIEENFYTESYVSSDVIIQSEADPIQHLSCEELIKFSCKAIEESQETEQPQLSLKNADSIVYSEMEICPEGDGSMKLCGEDLQSNKELFHSQREEVTKENILDLIEDYTLNPEAIKQIVFKIKFLQTSQLQRLYVTQSGEIAFVIESQLKTRGACNAGKQGLPCYEEFFIDEGKLFEKVKYGKQHDESEIIVPHLSSHFVNQWLILLLKSAGSGRPVQYKRIASFIRKTMLNSTNIHCVFIELLKLLTLKPQNFETNCPLPCSKALTPDWYKHVLIDSVCTAFVQQRVALSIMFFGWWSPRLSTLTSQPRQEDSCRVIQLILQVLLSTTEKSSLFLKAVLDYISCLNKTSRFVYPYFHLQDNIPLSSSLSQRISLHLRTNQQSFTDNLKLLQLFKIMSYLQLSTLKEFLKVELCKSAQIIKKVCEKEEHIIQHFCRLYGSEEGVELERKAQIYWKLRKSKQMEGRNKQLVVSRRILTDLSGQLLENIKENCFSLYYRKEETEMKEQLSYLHRRFTESRHYSQRHALEQEFKEKEQRFKLWKHNLMNLIVIEDINPAIEAVSGEIVMELRKSTSLIKDLHDLFGDIGSRTPILFGICSQIYKLMLAFELSKKEQEATFHSMSVLKTLPSINSTKEASAVRRKSSLSNYRTSAFMLTPADLKPCLSKFSHLVPSEALGLTPHDPLMGLHAKYADTETKLRYLKKENKLGQKTIEINRGSVWADTYPHLDEHFGDYEIKIAIKGEMGIDYGGVTREWVTMLIKEITDPRLGLFELNANELALQPSRMSYLVPNHLQIFRRLGIFVGKALKEGWLLQVNFTKSFLKHILGATLYVQDLQDIDPDTGRGLLWILKNYVGDELGLTFTYEEQAIRSKRLVELVPGGAEVPVTELNKKEYVKKLAYTKMTQNIREQSLSFISGVETIIPANYLRLFNYREIGKLLSGCAAIDIDEMQKYAKYEGFSEQDENICWFWQVMRSKSEEDKAEFLFFLTGSYRVPYSGFKEHPITINKMPSCKDYCPVAHTCFSIIDLPEYSSKEMLDKMLGCAIKEGKGFTVS